MSGKIVLIDSDLEFAKTTAEALRDKKFTVVASRVPAEAQSQIKKENPEMILVDPILKTGQLDFAFLQTLHAEAMKSRRHIMVLTTVKDRESIQKAVQAGAVDYLVKPLTPLEIVSRVQRNMPLEFTWAFVQQLLRSANVHEPRLFEIPKLKPWREKYLAFPQNVESRQLCLLIESTTKGSLLATQPEGEAKKAVRILQKHVTGWEDVWPQP